MCPLWLHTVVHDNDNADSDDDHAINDTRKEEELSE